MDDKLAAVKTVCHGLVKIRFVFKANPCDTLQLLQLALCHSVVKVRLRNIITALHGRQGLREADLEEEEPYSKNAWTSVGQGSVTHDILDPNAGRVSRE